MLFRRELGGEGDRIKCESIGFLRSFFEERKEIDTDLLFNR